MRYYTASGEPAGQWAGKGAAALGLSGTVDAKVMDRLYMQHVGPDGELLTRPRGKAAAEDDDQAAAAFRAVHPFASEVEVAEAVAKARGGARVSVPYYDLTVSAAKSVSVLHASLKIAAQEAFKRGDLVTAGKLHAEADGIEADLEAVARFAVERRSRSVLHPDRSPLLHDGGMAGRGGPDRVDVHPSHQPGRGPSAASAHRGREPGAAGRRRG